MGAQVTFEDQAAFVFVVSGTQYLLIYDIVGEAVRLRRRGHRQCLGG
jgi:hypothetical protein